MPQISKIRIVNFYYNNGHRMIPDELYDLTDAEGKHALDTLISLINGGGKSVLVQLMMQPVLPKARAAGRKLEGYFRRPGDHCFVVLEWLKDGSSEKLMTGIAIAAAQTAKAEETDSGTARIRYYTFYANYTDYTGNCNIIDLPLSGNEQERFVPAEFEDVRKLARKSGGKMQVYSSDENAKWADQLAQYGIFQQEWRSLMQPLNSVEGGMAEFFKGFKTSDALIDALLIPTIESRISGGQERSENSLAAMLTGFVRQYRAQSVKLERRSVCERYIQDMQAQKEQTDALWKLNDQKDTAVRGLFGFSAALHTEILSLETQQREQDEKLRHMQETYDRIRFEEASEHYYAAKQTAQASASQLAQAKQALDTLTEKAHETAERLAMMQAARHWEKCCRFESEIKALEVKLQAQSQGEAAAELNRLGASVHAAAELALKTASQQRSVLQTESTDCREQLDQAKRSCQQAVQAEREAKTALDKAEARCDAYCKDTDKALEKLDIAVMRGFTGALPDDEVQEYWQAAQMDLQQQQAQQRAYTLRLEQIAERLNAIPGELAALKIQKSALDSSHSAAAEERDVYLAADAAMQEICTLYSLHPESRFTDAVQDTLRQHRDAARADLRQCEYRLRTQEEELTAAQNGNLHVPQAVLRYLEQTGISFQTVESYFLTQINKGDLTAERAEAILAACPAAAYGILVQDADIRLLREAERPAWLPSAVPLFSMQDMNRILSGTAESPMLLAYYAEDAFRSRERFTESLQSARSQTETERDRLNSRITLLEEQIQTAVRFTYDAGWLTGQEQKIERILGEIASLEQTAGQLTDEKAALESEQQDVRQRLQESETAVHSAEERLEHIQAVLERLPQEVAFRNALDTARQQHAACQQALASASDEQKRLQAESDRLQNQIQQNGALCEELNAAIAKVQHCTGGEIQNGDWRGLLAQYEVLVKAQDASVREVQLQLDNVQANLRDARRELARIGCQPEQYQSVPYDEAEETRLKQQQSDIKADLADINDAHLKCVQKEAADRANLDHAQEALRDFGGQPLSPSEIAGNYEQRTRKLDAERSAILTEQAQTATRLQKLQRLSDRTALCLEKIPTPQQITETVLQEDAQKQWNALYGQFSEISKEQQSMHHRLEESLRELSAGYPDGAEHSALLDMQTILRSQEGDIYYSLDSMMETSLGVTKKYIAKINSDLADFDDSKHDLVRQCVLQGQQIWNGLVKMEKSAAVTLSEERTKTKLIRFDLPEQVDEISAKERICAELEQSVRELSDKLERGTHSEAELEKAAGRFVSSSRLLRTFIQKQQIGLKAFKIDSDKSLREYRTWESTAVDNSGAEKFLVYFAVILSVMHYTRSDDGISTQESTGVLILDNPFGVITSHHVLDKMFRIAKHFRVQLICLSDITKCDITACFSMHIKAKVKENKLSSVSLLTHEGNEQIEHGFYRASQMALL